MLFTIFMSHHRKFSRQHMLYIFSIHYKYDSKTPEFRLAMQQFYKMNLFWSPTKYNLNWKLNGNDLPKITISFKNYYKSRLQVTGTPSAKRIVRWLETTMSVRPIKLSKSTVEHILPKSLGSPELVHSLGNITLMTKVNNNKIGSKPFALRKSTYQQSKFTLTSGNPKYKFKGLHKYKKWDDKSIRKREKSLLRLLYRLRPVL